MREKLTCWVVLSALFSLAACGRPASDRDWMAREFALPEYASVVAFASSPREEESGTFGREGLFIKAVYQLPAATLARYEAGIAQSPHWHKLPLPARFGESFKLPGDFKRLFERAPEHDIKRGYYRCQTVGDQLLESGIRKDVVGGEKVNDYILGILDLDSGRLYCMVHAFY